MAIHEEKKAVSSIQIKALLFSFIFLFSAGVSRAAPSVQVKSAGTYPELWVDGKPFFIHGSAFFYYRLPSDLWEESLQTSKEMGINTIDLYIPWNWHEALENQLDFDGHSNPRKDILGLMRIISRLGLKAVIRPGPYICNEWKNGGYPDWLLKHPEYKMAPRSIAEGRYPPLSSLQYSDPETAAREWLGNETHKKYLERWYKNVIDKVVKPFSSEKGGPVILVQLDDDQPAGNRNNGPYFWKYMKWLRDIFLKAGVSSPLFLNPSESYVPALGNKDTGKPHLWMMTQWYQRFYGVDLTTSSYILLEPAVEYIKTDPEFPPVISEFNAGFFAMEFNPYGMPTHPTNTLTAARVLMQNGLKGFIHFPLQDFLYPAGYEIPSTNPYYTWESALDVSGKKKDKARSVERIGKLIRTQGELLASSHKWADVGVINPLGALNYTHLSTGAVDAVDAGIKTLEEWLIRNRINCEFVDPQNQPIEQLLRYPILLDPLSSKTALPAMSLQAANKLRQYVNGGGKLTPVDTTSANWQEVLSRLPVERKVQSGNWVYASELVSDRGSLTLGRRNKAVENFGFLMMTNLGNEKVESEMSATDPYDAGNRIPMGSLALPGKDSLCLPLRIRFSRLLEKLPLFLRDTDEIYMATSELEGIEADNSSVLLRFYTPENGRLKLKLKKAPLSLLLNGEEFRDYSVEPQSGLLAISLPRGKAPDFSQVLTLAYSSNITPTYDESKSTQPVYEFPTQIGYSIRPDVSLASYPPLILAERGDKKDFVSLILNNPEKTKKTVSVKWGPKGIVTETAENTVNIAPGDKRQLLFELPDSSGSKNVLFPGTLRIEDQNSQLEIPLSILRIPPFGAAYYTYDFDRDGNPESVLENAKIRVVVSPRSGGRIFQMVSKDTGANLVASPGILREIFTAMEPLDTAWDGKPLPSWTRSRIPGLNTRAYSVDRMIQSGSQASVSFSCFVPDVSPRGVTVKKTITLEGESSAIVVDYEIDVASAAISQELKISHVLLLDPASYLWYRENGLVQKESLAQAVRKDFHPAWMGIQNSSDSWAVELPSAASVMLNAKKNHVILEITLGNLSVPQTYHFRLRYLAEPDAIQTLQKEHIAP